MIPRLLGRPRPPDFIIIGAQRSGTTWLYYHLQRHPKIWMTPKKEVHYFDRDMVDSPSYANPMPLWRRITSNDRVARDWRRWVEIGFADYRATHKTEHIDLWTRLWFARFFLGRFDEAWYLSLFADAKDLLAGEATPDYLRMPPHAIAEVARVAPKAKILVIMRNPVDRFWSGLKYWNKMTSAMLEDESQRKRSMPTETTLREMDYAEALSAWSQHFPEDQIFSCFYEQLVIEPQKLLFDVCEFLGVPPLDDSGPATLNASKTDEIPEEFARDLNAAFLPLLERLHERFGSYATKWLEDARRRGRMEVLDSSQG